MIRTNNMSEVLWHETLHCHHCWDACADCWCWSVS